MSEVQLPFKHPGETRNISPGPERIATNNPFRRGTGSPAPSPGLAPGSPSRRPNSSRNPFLDGAALLMEPEVVERKAPSPTRPVRSRPVRSPTETQGLLANMSLEDAISPEGIQGQEALDGCTLTRKENEHPRRHHPSRSQEGRPRPEGMDGPAIFVPGPAQGVGRRPMPRGMPRPRRNSETSVSGRKSEDGESGARRGPRPPGASRSRPLKDSQGRPIPQKEHRPKKPNRRLDTIDKLDLSGIYGEGSFHHDGPFDACNPHRNRKGSTRAPMSAFAVGSLNNTIGGSGPLKKNIDLDRIHGRQEDSFNDFSAPAAAQPAPQYEPYVPGVQSRQGQGRDSADRISRFDGVDRTSRFDPTSKVDRLHGDESLGLGTSTFLEGAPAPRSAIQRRESEGAENGLVRKKSIVQRIRGINGNRPRGNSNGNSNNNSGMASPDGRYEHTSGEAQSAGGLRRINEKNPFFADHDAAYMQKGASIRAEEQKGGAASGGADHAAPNQYATTVTSGPVVDADQEAFSAVSRNRNASVGVYALNDAAPYALQRAVTEGSQPPVPLKDNAIPAADDTNKPKEGGGFLNRVKSLRGGKRDKPKV